MTTHPTSRRTGRIALGACLATGALLVAGCGGGSSSAPASSDSMGSMTMGSSPTSTGTSGTTTGAAATVTIKSFAFTGPSSVAPGAKITVKNEDSEAHTLTADGPGGFDVKIDPGASATFTAPTKPGTYPYHCTFHSNMHGTLTVK
ncbi:cupredoxin domain-containing protein [Nocardioides cynanchi]|uniref:cupredoxin domain-containing protein n=1 Tax=Nocardioides cynanchi TaxID=2558918 RepID=UPI001EE17163|nr:cupredoxin domain-containing protein [Nocardioides cynanchi]